MNLEHLYEYLGKNDFLAGGLGIVVVGGLLNAAKSYPLKALEWIKKQFIIEAEVLNSDPAFDWLSLWLHEHPYSKRSRKLTITTRPSTNDDELANIIFSPAPGYHFFFYKGRLVWMHRERQDKEGGKGIDSVLMKPKETLHFRMFGRSQRLVRELVEDARNAVDTERKAAFKIYISAYGCWYRMPIKLHRTLESVVLPDGISEQIVKDIKDFQSSKDWYQSLGIPYHRGYLLEGLPGTGKSSLVTALAAELKLDLYVLQLNGCGMSDSTLADLVRQMQPNSILLLEDIDAAVAKREEADEEDGKTSKISDGVSLSGLLNCLDGVLARDGAITFMTTNYAEKLDPALIRPGRIDMAVNFTHATPYQVRRMVKRFYPTVTEGATQQFVERFNKHSMAQVQQHLIKNKESWQQAVTAEISQ